MIQSLNVDNENDFKIEYKKKEIDQFSNKVANADNMIKKLTLWMLPSVRKACPETEKLI